MIKSTNSRVGTIGASDTRFVMMNFDTKTFQNWWMEKIGIKEHQEFRNIYADTGTMLEAAVIDTYRKMRGLELKNGEEPFISKRYNQLVVNLDAYNDTKNIEIKCVKYDKAFNWQFKMDVNYYQQVQVQMFATNLRDTTIVAYGLKSEDYDFDNLVNPKIDKDRIFEFDIDYDFEWIEQKYEPRLKYLCKCLDEGLIPREEEVQ